MWPRLPPAAPRASGTVRSGGEPRVGLAPEWTRVNTPEFPPHLKFHLCSAVSQLALPASCSAGLCAQLRLGTGLCCLRPATCYLIFHCRRAGEEEIKTNMWWQQVADMMNRHHQYQMAQSAPWLVEADFDRFWSEGNHHRGKSPKVLPRRALLNVNTSMGKYLQQGSCVFAGLPAASRNAGGASRPQHCVWNCVPSLPPVWLPASSSLQRSPGRPDSLQISHSPKQKAALWLIFLPPPLRISRRTGVISIPQGQISARLWSTNSTVWDCCGGFSNGRAINFLLPVLQSLQEQPNGVSDLLEAQSVH